MATPQNNPRRSASEEAAIQRRISSELGTARASGNPRLYFKQQGIIPGGYDVDNRGKLQYVQVDQGRPFYLDPKVAIPSIMSAGLLSPYYLGGSAAVTGAAGAAGTIGSSLPTMTSLSGAPIVAAYAPAASAAGSAAVGGGATAAGTIGGILGGGGVPAATNVAAPPLLNIIPKAAAGLSMRDIVKSALVPGLNAGLGIYGMKAQTNASRDAAAAMERSNAEALKYTRENDQLNRDEDARVQERNWQIFLEEQRYNRGQTEENRGLERDRQTRLDPYRRVGSSALAQFSRPIPGSIGALLRG